MTIDERIDALTHSVELLAQIHIDNERRMARNFARTNRYITQLALLVFDHEQRLRSIEDKDGENNG
jgi:hypothetical protein